MRTLLNYIYIIAFLVMLPIIAVAQADPAVVYVRCDYANYTSGGNGSDWEHAINGNA